jgi:hypothetical protein
MSNYNEIKTLFTNEITNSPQYQVAINIKNLLIQDIQTPSINYIFNYIFQESDYVDINNKDYEENIICFALKLILGIEVELYNDGMNRGIIVVMKKFIE